MFTMQRHSKIKLSLFMKFLLKQNNENTKYSIVNKKKNLQLLNIQAGCIQSLSECLRDNIVL
jgi:hypothetical protein